MSDNTIKVDIDHLIRKSMETLSSSNYNQNTNILDTLIKWLSEKKIYDQIDAEKIYISDSFLNSIKLIISEFVSKDDIMILDKFYDKKLLTIFELFEMDIKFIDHDNNGINTEQVEEILLNKPNNLTQVFLFLNTFNNIPSLNNLSDERIAKLNKICNEYDKFWIISNETENLTYSNSLSNLNYRILSLGNIDKNLDLYWIYNSNVDVINDLKNTQFVSCNLGKYEAQIFNQLFDDLDEYQSKKIKYFNQNLEIVTKRLDELNFNYHINNSIYRFLRVKIDQEIKLLDYNKNSPYNYQSLTFYFHEGKYDFNYILVDLEYDSSLIIRELIEINLFINTVNSYKLGIFTSNMDFLKKLTEEILKDKTLSFHRKIDNTIKLDPNLDILICNGTIEETDNFLQNCIDNKVSLPLVIKNTKGMNKNLISEYLKFGSVSVIGEVFEGRIILKHLTEFINSKFENWKKEIDSKNNNYIFDSEYESLNINHLIKDQISESLCYLKHVNLLRNQNEKCFYVDFKKIKIIETKKIENIQLDIYNIFGKKYCILDNDVNFEDKYKQYLNDYQLDFIINFVTIEGIYGDLSYNFKLYNLDGELENYNMFAVLALIKHLNDKYKVDKDEVSTYDYSSDFEIFDIFVKVSFPYSLEGNQNVVEEIENFKKELFEIINNLNVINISQEISIFNIEESVNIIVELDDNDKTLIEKISDDSYSLLTEIIIERYQNFINITDLDIIVTFVYCEVSSDSDSNELYIRSFDQKNELDFNDKSYLSAFEFFREYYVHDVDKVKIKIFSKEKSFIIEYEDDTYLNVLLSDIKKN